MVKVTTKIPLFRPSKLTIIQSEDYQSIIDKYEINADPNTLAAFVFDINFHYYVIVKKDTPVSILIHELNHVKNLIFRDFNIKHCYDNDEVESLLMEWLTEYSLKKLNK